MGGYSYPCPGCYSTQRAQTDVYQGGHAPAHALCAGCEEALAHLIAEGKVKLKPEENQPEGRAQAFAAYKKLHP